MKICLDAGHGKETPGKRSFDGSLREYEFNRDVTARVKNHLVRHGVSVVLSAPNDTDTSLAERCRIANASKVDIFVSIHANAFGTELNSASGWEIYSNPYSAKGAALAKCIHDESMPFLGIKDRGMKLEPFYVVKNTIAPAVLIEHGFYTNKDELELLKLDWFQEKCAIADAKGILKYFGITWIRETTSTAENEMTVEEAKKIVKEKAGLSDDTIQYLMFYEYNDELIVKLAKAMM